MTIIHGDNQPQSRQKLLEMITQARDTQTAISRWEATSLSLPILEELLGASDLFGQPKLIVIEGLHSLPKSKKKDQLIAFIRQASSDLPDWVDVTLWENRALTKTMLKGFPQATVFEYKVSNLVFKWLDSLSPETKTKAGQLKLFHQAIASEDEFMCLAMLIRQIRLLIQVKDGGTIAGPPFMVTKFKQQAKPFSLPALLAAHHRLLEIDLRQKTSAGILPLSQELDLFLLQL